jgi:hypothetical protein
VGAGLGKLGRFAQRHGLRQYALLHRGELGLRCRVQRHIHVAAIADHDPDAGIFRDQRPSLLLAQRRQ